MSGTIAQVWRGRLIVTLFFVVGLMLCHFAEAQTTGNAPVVAPWTYADIGDVGKAGNATQSSSSSAWTICAAGADIWDTADSFGYVYQPFVGDGWISVNTLSLQNTHTFSKVGLMLRETLDPGSAHVIVDVRPTGGIEFMTRLNAGDPTTYLAGASQAFPVWLMLYRNGSTVTAYIYDGTKPAAIGSTTVTMGQNLLVGLAVTSHDVTTTTTAMSYPPYVHTYAFGFPDRFLGRPGCRRRRSARQYNV